MRKKTAPKHGQIVFQATGGPHDGLPLMIKPPIAWMQKDLVLQSENGDGLWHRYLFNRLDYSARYMGVVEDSGRPVPEIVQ